MLTISQQVFRIITTSNCPRPVRFWLKQQTWSAIKLLYEATFSKPIDQFIPLHL